MTIVEFIEARLAEDEAVVRPIVDEIYGEYDGPADECQAGYVTIGAGRVLREVEAKRAILARHADGTPEWYDAEMRADDQAWCRWCTYDDRTVAYPCGDVLALASVYADHADFDATWRTVTV